MSSRLIVGLVLAFTLSLSPPASGQPSPRSPGALEGTNSVAVNKRLWHWLDKEPVHLVMLPSVQRELRLSKAQLKRIGELTTQLDQQLDEVIKQLDDQVVNGVGTKPGQGAVKPEGRLDSAYDKANKQLKATLSAAQDKRLHGIVLQRLGFSAFAAPSVESALELTDNQKKAISGAFLKHARALARKSGAPFTEYTGKMQELDQATMTEILGLLDEFQKRKWHRIIGKPFQP